MAVCSVSSVVTFASAWAVGRKASRSSRHSARASSRREKNVSSKKGTSLYSSVRRSSAPERGER